MSALLEGLTAYISNTSSTLAPLTLPLAPITPLTAFIDHVTTAHVHPTYFPFLRFGAIHAARVSLVWAGMTQSRKRPVTLLQDFFGYLVLACELLFSHRPPFTNPMRPSLTSGGGGTIVSLLLSQPPSWLADPTPWLIYPPIYFVLVQTGIARYMVSTAPTLINLFGAYIDGITRGTTITAVPKALAVGAYGTAASSALSGNLWTTALMSGLAVASGGWVVQGLGLHESEWKVGKPAILSGSVLDSLDLWSGTFTGLLYATLTRSHASLNPAGDLLAQVLPAELLVKGAGAGSNGLVEPNTARAICVLVLGSLLAARVVTKSVLSYKPAPKVVKQTREEILAELLDEKSTAVVKNPVQAGSGSKATPRKNKKGGSGKSP